MQAVCKHKYMRNIQMNHLARPHRANTHTQHTFQGRIVKANEHSQWKHQPSSEILTSEQDSSEEENHQERAAEGERKSEIVNVFSM
jgi:hypothetical protein